MQSFVVKKKKKLIIGKGVFPNSNLPSKMNKKIFFPDGNLRRKDGYNLCCSQPDDSLMPSLSHVTIPKIWPVSFAFYSLFRNMSIMTTIMVSSCPDLASQEVIF